MKLTDFEKEIIHNNRHYFIYGNDENKHKRKELLKEICKKNPVSLENKDKACGIYIEGQGLPYKEVDEDRKLFLSTFHDDYTSLLIFANVIKSLNESNDKQVLHEAVDYRFFDLLNYHFGLERKCKDFTELEHICFNILEQFPEFYDKFFESKDIKYLPFNLGIDIDYDSSLFILQRDLGYEGHFSIIYDQQTQLSLSAQKAINSIINTRCNGTLSMNVATDINNWDSYTDLAGNFIEAIYDYGEIELDSNVKDYTKEIIEKTRVL